MALKKAQKFRFSDLCALLGGCFRLYYNSFRGVQSGINYVFSERLHRGGGCVAGLQHFGELCARVLPDFRQVVFFRRECLCYSVHHSRASFLKNRYRFGFFYRLGLQERGGGFFLRFCRLGRFFRAGGLVAACHLQIAEQITHIKAFALAVGVLCR